MHDKSALFVRMAQRFLDRAVIVTSDEAVKKDIISLSASVKQIQEKHVVLNPVKRVKKEV